MKVYIITTGEEVPHFDSGKSWEQIIGVYADYDRARAICRAQIITFKQEDPVEWYETVRDHWKATNGQFIHLQTREVIQ